MPGLIPFADMAHLFEEFEHTAWRLETQRGYASDRGSPRWRRFLAGEPLGFDPAHPWHANVRAQTERGKRFERVRLVDNPPTEGQRFLMASGMGNAAAGEDIRNMWRADAHRLALPDFDFWLFDSRLMAKFQFDKDGRPLGLELTDDPTAVVKACQVRDAAWHYAIPTANFAPRIPPSP